MVISFLTYQILLLFLSSFEAHLFETGYCIPVKSTKHVLSGLLIQEEEKSFKKANLNLCCRILLACYYFVSLPRLIECIILIEKNSASTAPPSCFVFQMAV